MFKTVEDFKSSITGIAQANKYYIDFAGTNQIFSRIKTIFPKDEYKYLALSVEVPGQELNQSIINFWGRKKDIASSIDYDPITVTFVCDSNLKIRRFFEDWIDMIIDKTTFTVSYYEDYVLDLVITVLNRALVPIREYKIEEVYPKSINAITLNYDTNDTPMQFNVSFAYWSIEIKNLIKEG